ncbi:MAG: hypothetical protein B6I24_10355 [Bacteroidetes bacterium 4572_128]|nr:MAG: hypothetical protein B6I24_10355 [Bacteroidetes bacterium 4572_128]
MSFSKSITIGFLDFNELIFCNSIFNIFIIFFFTKIHFFYKNLIKNNFFSKFEKIFIKKNVYF